MSNINLDLKKEQLLKELDNLYNKNKSQFVEESSETDEDLLFNYVWNKYYSYFEKYFYDKYFPNVESSGNPNEKLNADTIEKIALETMQSKGLAYDSTTGLYYDAENGLYYDQARKLYFDNENGVYYHYVLNKYTNKYNLRFYSRIKSKRWKRMCQLRDKDFISLDANQDIEDKNESNSEDDSDGIDDIIMNLNNQNQINKYPPCIRAILTKSNSENFQTGSLFIIPYTGGFIGDSVKHKFDSANKPSFVIDFKNEENVDEIIAKIEYDLNEKSYFITAETNCNQELILNNKKLSATEREKINHGDILDISDKFQLSLHIHSGMNSCVKCEPGEIMHKIKIEKEILNKAISKLDIKSKEDIRKEKIKSIKKKYGLKWNNIDAQNSCNKYKDRSKQRRDAVGVDYSHLDNMESNENMSSTEKKLNESNKGRKMLEKMGWKEGIGLGKYETGIIEPINPKLKLTKSGLGTEKDELNIDTDEKTKKKMIVWKKTIQRLEQTNNAVFNNMEEDKDDQLI